MSLTEGNVWNGGPEPTNASDGAKSLGELCLKRFKEQGDDVKMVCPKNIFFLNRKPMTIRYSD